MKKPKKAIFLLSLIFPLVQFAQTTIPGGNVSGTWKTEGSPYLITGNIIIPQDSTLIIEPGVSVVFQEFRKFTIDGTIKANGTENDSIYFTNDNSKWNCSIKKGKGEWRGFEFIGNLSEDTSTFFYCRMEYSKSSNNSNSHYGYGGLFYIAARNNIHIKHCIITNNSAVYGGAFFISNSENIIISENKVQYNYASDRAAGFLIHSSCTINGNLIANNTSHWGGGIYVSDFSPKIINNVICNNVADVGAGFFIFDAYFMSGYDYIANNTIANNTANEYAPAILLADSYTSFKNCIIYNNTSPEDDHQVFLQWGAQSSFQYCDIEGGINGIIMDTGEPFAGTYENNIDSNPWTLWGNGDKYTLQKGSSCINAGSPDTTGLLLPVHDFAGNPRIDADTIDIGAYEYQYTVGADRHDKYEFIKVFPNPTSGIFQIKDLYENHESHSIELFNSFGKKLMEFETIEKIIQIDLTGKPKGVYLIRIKSGSGIINKKIIVQ
jgi:hypothetical protein